MTQVRVGGEDSQGLPLLLLLFKCKRAFIGQGIGRIYIMQMQLKSYQVIIYAISAFRL